MKSDTLDFVERFCCKVALSAVSATHHWDIFDDYQVFPLAVGFSNPVDARAFFSTNVTYHLRSSVFIRGEFRFRQRELALRSES